MSHNGRTNYLQRGVRGGGKCPSPANSARNHHAPDETTRNATDTQTSETTMNTKLQFKGNILLAALVGYGLFYAPTLGRATCDGIAANGQCPSLTPTSASQCPNCETYYTYSPITTYVSGDVLGPCKDPSVTSVSIPYTEHYNEVQNLCAIVGICRYLTIERSTPCTTTTCEDWCSEG